MPMHWKRHKPNPKHDSHEVNDTSYRAGRAYAILKKKMPKLISAKDYEDGVDLSG